MKTIIIAETNHTDAQISTLSDIGQIKNECNNIMIQEEDYLSNTKGEKWNAITSGRSKVEILWPDEIA